MRKPPFAITLATFVAISMIPPCATAQSSEHSYKADPKGCKSFLAMIGIRSEERTKGYDSFLPAEPNQRTLLIHLGDGLSTITHSSGDSWKVPAPYYIAVRRGPSGKVDMVDVSFADSHLFEVETGKPIQIQGELWIVRSPDNSHCAVAQSITDAPTFFLQDSSQSRLAVAARNREGLEARLSRVSRDNSRLLYALPRTEAELESMALNVGKLDDWTRLAGRVDELKLKQIEPDIEGRFLEEISRSIENGENVLIWAHALSPTDLVLPVVESPGAPRRLISLDTYTLGEYIAAGAGRSKNPGLVISNVCFAADDLGLSTAISSATPVVVPKERYATSGIGVLEQIASGQFSKSSLGSSGIALSLSIVLVSGMEEDNTETEIESDAMP